MKHRDPPLKKRKGFFLEHAPWWISESVRLRGWYWYYSNSNLKRPAATRSISHEIEYSETWKHALTSEIKKHQILQKRLQLREYDHESDQNK